MECRNPSNPVPKGGSSLSIPVRNGNCFCHGSQESNQKMDSKTESRFPSMINVEKATLEKQNRRLSIKERDSAEQTIRFGDFPENPEFLETKLLELELELTNLEFEATSSLDDGSTQRDPDFAAYKLARDQDPAYVEDRQFRIDFLRSERYDARKATRRFLRFFREKLELFGREKLTRDIYLEDLGEDGLACLRLGMFQVVPKRDAAGRRVIFSYERSVPLGYTLGARKALFYFMMSLIEDDDEVGRARGLVGIIWRIHKLNRPGKECLEENYRVRDCCPNKISAMHLCSDPISFGSIESVNEIAAVFLPSILNIGLFRFCKTHCGTSMKCRYDLIKEYGCPADCFPLEDGNNGILFHTHTHNKWIYHRITLEHQKKQKLAAASIMPEPRRNFFVPFNNPPIPASVESNSNGSEAPSTKPANTGNTEKAYDSDHTRTTAISTSTSSASQKPSFRTTTGSNSSLASKCLAANSMASDLLCSSDITTDDSDSILNWDIESLNPDNFLGADHSDLDEISDLFGIPPDDSFDSTDTHPTTNQRVRKLSVSSDSRGQRNIGDNSRSVANSSSATNYVQDKDVLLGRGRPLQKHPGNVRFRELVAEHAERYERSSKRQKIGLSRYVVRRISATGGRFLKEGEISSPGRRPKQGGPPIKGWVELDDREAHEKVAYTFRNFRKKERRRALSAPSNSSSFTGVAPSSNASL